MAAGRLVAIRPTLRGIACAADATTWYEGDGLGKGTFGHGSATSTTIRIDPENNLVIVMNRNGRGRNFNKYHPKFIQAVTGSLARQPEK